MDNIGALPVRIDFHAASISTIFSPAFRRSWFTGSTLSRCHRAALPAFARFLAKTNDASAPQRFHRNPRSVSSLVRTMSSVPPCGKTIAAENCLLPFEPHREKPVRQVRRTTHNTPSRQCHPRRSLRRPGLESRGLHRIGPKRVQSVQPKRNRL